MTQQRLLGRTWIWLVTISLNRIWISGQIGPPSLPQQDIALALGENPNEDQAITEWCSMKHIVDKNECLKKLHQWCDNGNDTSRILSVCKSFKNISDQLLIRATEAPKMASTYVIRLPTQQTTHQPNKPKAIVKRPKKAQRQSLTNLKGKLNERQKDKVLASPIMNDNPAIFQVRNLDARIQQTELDVNDPENYFHGDVDLTEEQLKSIEDSVDRENQQHTNRRKKRKVGKPPSFHLWDSFPISYQFDASVPEDTRTIITKAIQVLKGNNVKYENMKGYL